jgi:ubiquinone/menaquinone biosynthesis C-methylase UbiE
MLVDQAYEDSIAMATKNALAAGGKVLQIHRLCEDEAGHCGKLLGMLNPPSEALIADMGSGIGAVAKEMQMLRPDLRFLLVNNNQWQTQNSEGGERIYADFHDTGIESGRCDAVMFNYSIGYADLPVAMEEASRILKPGGILFIWDFSGQSELMLACLGYRVHQSEGVIRSAKGMSLDWVARPDTYIGHFYKLLDEATRPLWRQIESEVAPTAWRFIKA